MTNRRWLIAFSLFALVLLGICLAAYLGRIPSSIAHIPYYDIIGHFVLYGLFAGLLELALGHHRIRVPGTGLRIPTAAIIIMVIGTVDELLQNLSPLRSADLKDLTADFVGIIIAVWLAQLIKISKPTVRSANSRD